MTNLTNPMDAEVFIVGANQATAYTDEHIQSHDQHLDILFNRNGYNCFSFYQTVRGGKPSKTRVNINRLSEILSEFGINNVLETNLYCYSTKSFSDLRKPEHAAGREVGIKIFETMVQFIRPRILILHGAKVREEFCKVFKTELPVFLRMGGIPVRPKTPFQREVDIENFRVVVFPIPSLAPPAANSWATWADEYLTEVGAIVKDILNR